MKPTNTHFRMFHVAVTGKDAHQEPQGSPFVSWKGLQHNRSTIE